MKSVSISKTWFYLLKHVLANNYWVSKDLNMTQSFNHSMSYALLSCQQWFCQIQCHRHWKQETPPPLSPRVPFVCWDLVVPRLPSFKTASARVMIHPHLSFHPTAPLSPLSFHHKASKAQPLVSVGSVINTVGVRCMSPDCQNLSSSLNPGQKPRTPCCHAASYCLLWSRFLERLLHALTSVIQSALHHTPGREKKLDWFQSRLLWTMHRHNCKSRNADQGLGAGVTVLVDSFLRQPTKQLQCCLQFTLVRQELLYTPGLRYVGGGRSVKLVLVETRRVCNRSK